MIAHGAFDFRVLVTLQQLGELEQEGVHHPCVSISKHCCRYSLTPEVSAACSLRVCELEKCSVVASGQERLLLYVERTCIFLVLYLEAVHAFSPSVGLVGGFS